MIQGSTDSDRYSIRTSLFGLLVLALGMGIGRFLYTPMLALLLTEGHFSFGQLSWIASANYAGYLAGSLLFSFGLFHLPSRLRSMLLTSAVATGGLIVAMSVFTQPALVMLIRFLAGVASAGMMIFGTMTVLLHTRHPFVIASLFSGVGAGIILGNEYVIAGIQMSLASHALWLGAGALSGLLLLLLAWLIPGRAHALPPAPLATARNPVMRWWQLALLYGLAGFGYIIVATYLPLMARDAGSPKIALHLWSLVGLAIIPGCFGWLWAAKRWGVLQCLTANLIIQGVCVMLTLASDAPLLLIVSSIGFGATFMGTTSLVMPLARQLSVPGNINLLGVVTLTYGIGQIVGPMLTSMLGSGSEALTYATLWGAAALFLAATISAIQLYKR